MVAGSMGVTQWLFFVAKIFPRLFDNARALMLVFWCFFE